MPYPRPPHTIELTIPHVLTDAQFEELEDLTFLHFNDTLDAWPISLKITSELNETIYLPPPPPPFEDDHTSDSDAGSSASASPAGSPPPPIPVSTGGGGGDVTSVKITKISVSTSTQWDPRSEEAVRSIVRNILVEIMGGGIQIQRV